MVYIVRIFVFLLFSCLCTASWAFPHASGALLLSIAPKEGVTYTFKYGASTITEKIPEGTPIVLLGAESRGKVYEIFDFGGRIDKGTSSPKSRVSATREVYEETAGAYNLGIEKFHNYRSVVSQFHNNSFRVPNASANHFIADSEYQAFYVFVPYIPVKDLVSRALKLKAQVKANTATPDDIHLKKHIEKGGWIWVPIVDLIHYADNVSQANSYLVPRLFDGLISFLSTGVNFPASRWQKGLNMPRDHFRIAPQTHKYLKRQLVNGSVYKLPLGLVYETEIWSGSPGRNHLLKALDRLERGLLHWPEDRKTSVGPEPMGQLKMLGGRGRLFISFEDDGPKLDPIMQGSGYSAPKKPHITIADIKFIRSEDVDALELHIRNALYAAGPAPHFQSSFVDEYLVNRTPGASLIVIYPENEKAFSRYNTIVANALQTFKSKTGIQYQLSPDTQPQVFTPHVTLLTTKEINHDDRSVQFSLQRRPALLMLLNDNLNNIHKLPFIVRDYPTIRAAKGRLKDDGQSFDGKVMYAGKSLSFSMQPALTLDADTISNKIKTALQKSFQYRIQMIQGSKLPEDQLHLIKLKENLKKVS